MGNVRHLVTSGSLEGSSSSSRRVSTSLASKVAGLEGDGLSNKEGMIAHRLLDVRFVLGVLALVE
jgi:hypothetical protein